jgi:hypothetical protein
MNVDTIPPLSHRKTPRRIIITSARSHGGDFMPSLDQFQCQIREMLGRGHMVRMEALVDQENTQSALEPG